MPNKTPPDNTRTAIRMAFFYGAVFALIGIHAPFWPVWLAAKGLGPTEIGAILAVSLGTKVVFNPVVAHIADRRGQRRPIIISLAVAAFASFTLFALTDTFWPILVVSILFFAVWSPIMPLGESLAMLPKPEAGPGGGDKSKELDYGRVRLWGSLTFIAGAVGTGIVLTDGSTDIIYWAVLGSLVLVIAVSLALPATQAPAATETRFAALAVLRQPGFVLFVVSCALIQASHSVYYGFGTLNWKAQGYSETVIGWLWAEGVIAEIILFVYGVRLVGRLGPARLIVLGGLAGAIRWTVTGATDGMPGALAVLVLMQLLHAFTFAATHLGAIYFITRRVPPALSASAQSLYSAVVMGLVLGAAMLGSGKLYDLYGGGAYQAMAVMAAFGGIAAVFLVRRPLK